MTSRSFAVLTRSWGCALLAANLVSVLLVAQSQPAAAPTAPAQAPAPSATRAANNDLTANGHLPGLPRRERSYYSLFWGVDSLRTKAVESGELIQFSYRVIDAERAKVLNDKSNEAFLFAPDIRAKLIVPSLEKVGQLRQTSTPEQGKIYWMAFSNPGKVVKKGDRVDVQIGKFHVEGLLVE